MLESVERVRAGFPDRVRLPLAFDPERLMADLERIGEGDWVNHAVRQNYVGGWSVAPLRAAAGETHPLRLIYADPSAAEFVDTALLARTPYLAEVLGRLRCPLKSARLMRLSPGSEIKEHCDPDLDAELGTARLHVPISTNDGVEFRLGGRPVAMAPGSLWYLRLTDPHSAANRGASDRVHLVIDARMNDWLEEMLEKGFNPDSAAASARLPER